MVTPYDPPDHADVWAQTLAAVAYLADTTRPGFTIWDAVDEAVREWIAGMLELPAPAEAPAWDDPDRLRTSMTTLLTVTAPAGAAVSDPLADLLSAALHSWVLKLADEVNDGYRFALAAGWLPDCSRFRTDGS
jgi:hypothetical protein